MPTVLRRIGGYSQILTKSESKIAQYLNKHPDQVIKLSMKEVSKRCGVSIASVSRFANTIGYRNWKEMCLDLAQDCKTLENPVFSEITCDDPDDVVACKLFDCTILSLRDTYEQLDKKRLSRLISEITESKRIVFFGSGGSGCIAKDEALRFAHLEISAEAYYEEFQMMLQASRMKKGEIAFGFSNSGRSQATVNALIEAKKNNALTIGIANYRNTPLEEISDIFLGTSYQGRGEFVAALTARIPTLCIMDVIYVLLVQHGMLHSDVNHITQTLESKLRLVPR